jgi:hypothetical protein
VLQTRSIWLALPNMDSKKFTQTTDIFSLPHRNLV